jgi:hypothetical protein
VNRIFAAANTGNKIVSGITCGGFLSGNRKQLSAFLEGFYDIIPRRLISIFNEQELELLLSGNLAHLA